jgi:hypothetical protein
MIKLPDEQIGHMFVFRVFEAVSYALVMRTTQAIKVGDRFTQPDDVAFQTRMETLPRSFRENVTPGAQGVITPGDAPKATPRP